MKFPAFFSAAFLAATSLSQAALDASASFEVFPSDVNLTYQRDRQSLVVRITEANGVRPS